MIGIIGAMDIEIDSLNEKMEGIKQEKIGATVYSTGKIFGKDVVTAVCGIGKVAAAMCAQTMILKFNPDVIINTGIGGGIGEGLNVCDVVLAERAIQHDFDLMSMNYEKGYNPAIGMIAMPANEALCEKILEASSSIGESLKRGTIVSGDQFIASKEKKDELVRDFNGTVCEMEGGSIAQVCTMWKKPFAILRAISDNGDDSAGMTYDTFCEIAAKKAIDILSEYIKIA